MRILLAGQTYFREDNGQAVFTCRLAKGLAAQNHQVLVIAPSPDKTTGYTVQERVLLLQVPTLRLPFNCNLTFHARDAIAEAMESFQPDIVHLQDHYFLTRSVFTAARKNGVPQVGTNHFLPDNIADNLCLPRWSRPLATRLLWAHMLARYNRLHYVTAPTRTGVTILEEQRLRPPTQPISCGIDTDRFQPPTLSARRLARKQFALDQEQTVFLYVGRLDHEKGLDTVVRAFAALDDDQTRLILAGRGSYRTALIKCCTRLNITQKVLLPGFVPEADLPALLHCADCFIMAGHAELQSIATLEAMASGLPVLAADARALPELVTDHCNGFLFPPRSVNALEQAFRRFLRNRHQWPTWGEESRRRACTHDHTRTVEAYARLYRQVLQLDT